MKDLEPYIELRLIFYKFSFTNKTRKVNETYYKMRDCKKNDLNSKGTFIDHIGVFCIDDPNNEIYL